MARMYIIIISIIAATFFVSVGYGSWEQKLVIKGTINVVEPVQNEGSGNKSVSQEVYFN